MADEVKQAQAPDIGKIMAYEDGEMSDARQPRRLRKRSKQVGASKINSP